MPVIVPAEQTRVTREGLGWQEITLADAAVFGQPAMVARRLILEPGASGPPARHVDADQLLYVIRGHGRAVVDGRDFSLNEESVLWLEPGDRYHFVAGDEGLEILQAYAPGAP
jgi:quercetin dioxygenase-like cupin family protein